MPYDPRPVTKGSNRGIYIEFSRMAPKWYHRVVGVDTFDGGDWVVGDYGSKAKAIKIANEKAGQMTKMHVYNSKGKWIYSAGTF